MVELHLVAHLVQLARLEQGGRLAAEDLAAEDPGRRGAAPELAAPPKDAIVTLRHSAHIVGRDGRPVDRRWILDRSACACAGREGGRGLGLGSGLGYI